MEKEYQKPELIVVGDAAEVVLGMGGSGTDSFDSHTVDEPGEND